jgi:hypothetical protein
VGPAGPTGSQGPQGQTGPTGATGPTGPPGYPHFAHLTNEWFYPLSQTARAAGTATSNALRIAPWVCDDTFTVQGIVADITAAGQAGATFRIGIYNSDPTTGRPGSLLYDSGPLPADTINSANVAGLALPFVFGRTYWLGGVGQNCATTPPGVNILGAGMCYVQSFPFTTGAVMGPSGSTGSLIMNGVAGALPDPFVITPGSTTASPRLGLRAA